MRADTPAPAPARAGGEASDPRSSVAGARTCGARIPMRASVRQDAYAQARGVPGLVRASLPCVLAVHAPEVEHAALARPLHRQRGGAVWAYWTQPTVVSCTAREDCQLGEPQLSCDLFAKHPGPCSGALGVLAEDETRALRIGRAREILENHSAYDAGTLAEAGHDVLLLAWDELRALGIWNRLPEWDKAAVHRTITAAAPPVARDAAYVDRLLSSHKVLTLLLTSGALPDGEAAAQLAAELAELAPGWQAVVLGQQREPRHPTSTPRTPLADAVRAAADRFAADETPTPAGPRWRTDWDDEDDRQRGAAVAGGMARLPYGWHVDAVRRIARGLSALAAVHDAALARNMLRGHGICIPPSSSSAKPR